MYAHCTYWQCRARTCGEVGVSEGAHATCVYFLQRGVDGPIKIGVTQDIERRRAQLQTAHDERLILRGLVEGDRDYEQILHTRFWSAHIRGEWFEPVPELVRFIAAESGEVKELGGHNFCVECVAENPPRLYCVGDARYAESVRFWSGA